MDNTKCIDCKQWCSSGELVDGARCFDCWMVWRDNEDRREAREAVPGVTDEQAARIAFMRNVKRGKHAKAW